MLEGASTPEVFAHRAGWTRPEIQNGAIHEQNSLPQAQESLRYVSGCEVDVGFTADGVAVITHDNVSKLTFAEFQQQHPDHGTLEDWISWYEQPGMEEKQLYLDLKGTEQDPYELTKLVGQLGERASIGSKDPATVFKLLVARKLLSTDAKIYLQIPDPVAPGIAVKYADNLESVVGMDQVSPEIHSEIAGLKPDGLHFYWPENVLKDIVSEIKKHGEFVPLLDQIKDPNVVRFPNLFGFHNLQRLRLEGFVKVAKKHGYKVCAGSVASPEVMERMMAWGVDAIMPNMPKHSPVKIENPSSIPEPATKHTHQKTLRESDVVKSPSDDALRNTYTKLTQNVRSISPIRQQFGF